MMVCDGRWKLIHAEGGFRPMLFDLKADPDELVDLAKGTPDHPALAVMYDHLATWGRRMAQRVTLSDADIVASRGKAGRKGILPFLVDGSEVEPELTARYRGPVAQDFTEGET